MSNLWEMTHLAGDGTPDVEATAVWDGLDAESREWLSGALDEPMPDRDEGHRLEALLAVAVAAGASDLHLSSGCAPHLRIAGQLRPMANEGPMQAEDLRRLVFSSLSESQASELQSTGDLDTALEVRTGSGKARVRANCFRQSGAFAAAFRIIPTEIPDIAALGLPSVVSSLARSSSGLILVTGATGSGKTTTVAAMLDLLNRHEARHIVTIEDPIEFRHRSRHSIVQQREVGADTLDFASGLRHALRQDPDVIVLGELRDLETIRTALTAAETGHLVLGTLHSTDTSGAIHRIIDVFPADQQSQIRAQLALSLRGVTSQELVAAQDRVVPLMEVLIATDAVRNLIREEKVHQLLSVIETSAGHGMQSMGQARASAGLATSTAGRR